MRVLKLNEVQQVSGASVWSDLQSLGQNGISRPEQTLSVLCLGTGAIVGGLLTAPFGTILGVGSIAAWIGFDIYKSYYSQTAA